MPNEFFARICVILFEPHDLQAEPESALILTESPMIAVARDDGPAVGYYVEVGLRCPPERVIDVIDYAVADGEVHWGRTQWHEVVIEELPPALRRHVNVDHEEVWYRGDRDYFRRW
jgi:hypothetical protein